MTFCDPARLRQAIQDAGLTVDGAARSAGMDRSSLRRLLRSPPKRGWSCDTADRLASVCKVEVGYLIRGDHGKTEP
jgi:hypothetical protein